LKLLQSVGERSLGKHVNDITVAKKSQIKHEFRKFTKHALEVRKQINVTTTIRKSQLKQAFGTLANLALKPGKEVKDDAGAQKSFVKAQLKRLQHTRSRLSLSPR
jgi:hypothetical protein